MADTSATDFAKIMAAAFASGSPGTEVTAPDGTRMRVEATDQPGVDRMLRGDSEDGPWSMRLYRALPVAPEGFPAYPFIANECFCLMEFANDKIMLVWWGRSGAERVSQQMVGQSEREGWTAAPNDDELAEAQKQLGVMGGGSMSELRFLKEGRVRSIVNGTFGPIAYASMIERAG